MATLSIGDTQQTLQPMPEPKKEGLTVNVQDIDAATTTRSANGTMLRDRVAGGANAKRKLEVEWPPMSSAEISTILQAIQGKFFWVEYPDPYTGTTRVAQFYSGDRSAPVYSCALGTTPLWKGLKANFIEK